MGRRVEVEAADRPVVVAVGGDLLGVGPERLAEELAGGPLVLLAEDVVVEVLEELELDRLGEPLGRLDPVDDDPPRAADEVRVEERDRVAEDPGQVGLPGVPVVGLEVAAGDAPAGAGERVEVVAERRGRSPRRPSRSTGPSDGYSSQVPAELRRGVAGVVLGVAPAGEVADDPAAALGLEPVVGPAQPELGLARAGRPGQDGQGAREEPAAEELVEGFDPERLSWPAHDRWLRETLERRPIVWPGRPIW